MLTSKALAGYLETASGRSLVFAAFVNNVPLDAPKPNRSISDATAQAGRLLGKLCEALYTDSGDTAGQAKGGRARSGRFEAGGLTRTRFTVEEFGSGAACHSGSCCAIPY